MSTTVSGCCCCSCCPTTLLCAGDPASLFLDVVATCHDTGTLCPSPWDTETVELVWDSGNNWWRGCKTLTSGAITKSYLFTFSCLTPNPPNEGTYRLSVVVRDGGDCFSGSICQSLTSTDAVPDSCDPLDWTVDPWTLAAACWLCGACAFQVDLAVNVHE